MKKELEQALVKEFPYCFGGVGKPLTQSLMGFGCECGDGWYNIIREACAKAEPIIAAWVEEHKNGADFNADWAPQLSQVKEKYGTLRMYWSTYPDGIGEIESAAEKKSARICEQCGKKGKLRGQGWVYTACFKHAKLEDRDNFEVVKDAHKKHLKKRGKTK